MSEMIANLEQKFSKLVRSYQKDRYGKGPQIIKVNFSRNWAITQMSGCLTSVELFIAQTDKGYDTIRKARTLMMTEQFNELPPNELEEVVGGKYVKIFTDIDIENDEVVSIFVFNQPIDGTDKMYAF
ncbi:DUF2294 domain-containing protein [Alkalihalobacillus sp. 1P02AB]|uniref:DUF2294 domain-containing protein n=1 Tax=Alkalihalobacillus sp. 1P02AB TaxID=3132260 RepID=UPI0039A641C2